MGVAGAALSTLMARVLGAMFSSSIYPQEQRSEARVNYKELLILKKDMSSPYSLILRYQDGVENGLFQLGRVLVVSIIAMFGTAQTAANAGANTLDSMVLCSAGQAANLCHDYGSWKMYGSRRQGTGNLLY